MGNVANKAQKILLDNNCGDLILNDTRAKNAKDRIYASDIMMKFLESERGQKVDTGERQSNILNVSNHVCHTCKGTGLVYIDDVIKNTLCPDC